MDPLGKTAGYDPQAAAISSAYLSAYNDYARKQLGVTADKVYRPRKLMEWIWKHESPRRIGIGFLPTSTVKPK
jgi:hypothetical protein